MSTKSWNISIRTHYLHNVEIGTIERTKFFEVVIYHNLSFESDMNYVKGKLPRKIDLL